LRLLVQDEDSIFANTIFAEGVSLFQVPSRECQEVELLQLAGRGTAAAWIWGLESFQSRLGLGQLKAHSVQP